MCRYGIDEAQRGLGLARVSMAGTRGEAIVDKLRVGILGLGRGYAHLRNFLNLMIPLVLCPNPRLGDSPLRTPRSRRADVALRRVGVSDGSAPGCLRPSPRGSGPGGLHPALYVRAGNAFRWGPGGIDRDCPPALLNIYPIRTPSPHARDPLGGPSPPEIADDGRTEPQRDSAPRTACAQALA